MQAKSAKTTCIALADDDARMVRLVRSNLEKMGFRIVTATDGPATIELVEAEDPDLLVLDVMMPGMDGVEVLRRLREFTWLPVIVLSGRDEEADIVRGLEAGADDYVTKPFAPRGAAGPDSFGAASGELRRGRASSLGPEKWAAHHRLCATSRHA